jgi:hypothetical protein
MNEQLAGRGCTQHSESSAGDRRSAAEVMHSMYLVASLGHGKSTKMGSSKLLPNRDQESFTGKK